MNKFDEKVKDNKYNTIKIINNEKLRKSHSIANQTQ